MAATKSISAVGCKMNFRNSLSDLTNPVPEYYLGRGSESPNMTDAQKWSSYYSSLDML